jgi:hypothetical protein
MFYYAVIFGAKKRFSIYEARDPRHNIGGYPETRISLEKLLFTNFSSGRYSGNFYNIEYIRTRHIVEDLSSAMHLVIKRLLN